MLPKYKEGSIDAVWASWDELAKGAYKALTEAGRTDIPIISVDVSNQDINFMRQKPDLWRASAAVDPNMIGRVCTRILAKKMKGEETPKTYEFDPKLINSKDLKKDTSMSNLGEVIEGWNVSDAFNEPWMDALRAENK